MQPDTPSTFKPTSDYCSNGYDACPQPNVFNHENYVSELEMAQMTYQYPYGYDPLTTTEAMHSPSYGGYPELPSMGPTNPFCANGHDQSYQNQEGIIPYPYPGDTTEPVPYVQDTGHNYFQYPQY